MGGGRGRDQHGVTRDGGGGTESGIGRGRYDDAKKQLRRNNFECRSEVLHVTHACARVRAMGDLM